MSPFPYDALWHYSEKFTRDPDLRQDLVLMAWKEDARLADRSDVRLLKNYMKLRAKEINFRSPLGADISGKRKKDVWRHERVSMFKRVSDGREFCLADTLSCVAFDPFGLTVVNDFSNALPPLEGRVAKQIIAGYSEREARAHLGITPKMFREAKANVREMALEYLM